MANLFTKPITRVKLKNFFNSLNFLLALFATIFFLFPLPHCDLKEIKKIIKKKNSKKYLYVFCSCLLTPKRVMKGIEICALLHLIEGVTLVPMWGMTDKNPLCPDFMDKTCWDFFLANKNGQFSVLPKHFFFLVNFVTFGTAFSNKFCFNLC